MYLPPGVMTGDTWKIMMEKNPKCLCDVPFLKRTKEICIISLRHGGYYGDIPWHFKSKKMLNLAIENNHANIRHVPKKALTNDLCKKLACVGHGGLISYVPEKFIDQEFVDSVIATLISKKSNINLLKFPLKFISRKYAIKLIDHNSLINPYDNPFRGIPHKYITPDVIEHVLNKDTKYVRYVPGNLLTDEMIEQYS
jgi:hypothetical protein